MSAGTYRKYKATFHAAPPATLSPAPPPPAIAAIAAPPARCDSLAGATSARRSAVWAGAAAWGGALRGALGDGLREGRLGTGWGADRRPVVTVAVPARRGAHESVA